MMASRRLVLSPLAKDDLTNIFQFGAQTWGLAQASSYLESIKEQLATLMVYPLIGVERAKLLEGARSIPVENHVIFYRVQSTKVEILRILHEKQDPERHINPPSARPRERRASRDA